MLLCLGVLDLCKNEAQVARFSQHFLLEDICDFFEFPNERIAITVILRQYEAKMGLFESSECAYEDVDIEKEIMAIIIES